MAGFCLYVMVIVCILQQTNGADQALNADCTAITDTCATANAICTGTGGGSGSAQCLCSGINGYYEASSACATVLGSTCTNDAAGNTLCATTRALVNSECTSGLACVCTSGYTAETSAGIYICRRDADQTCTTAGVDCVTHAVCTDTNEDGTPETCKCESPYTKSGTVCVDSSAVGATTASVWLLMSMAAAVSSLILF